MVKGQAAGQMADCADRSCAAVQECKGAKGIYKVLFAFQDPWRHRIAEVSSEFTDFKFQVLCREDAFRVKLKCPAFFNSLCSTFVNSLCGPSDLTCNPSEHSATRSSNVQYALRTIHYSRSKRLTRRNSEYRIL